MIAEKMGSFLRRILVSWQGRIGSCVFLIFCLIGGFWTGFWMTILYVVVLWFWGRRGTAQGESFDTTHGSARWANNQDLFNSDNMTLQLETDRYLLGVSSEIIRLIKQNLQKAALTTQLKRQGLICLPLIVTGSKDSNLPRTDDGHILTIAGSGAGKGVAVVIPNLMVYQGSVVVLDPKGENFISTYKARVNLGHQVCLVDPFNTVPKEIRDKYQVGFNPLDLLEKFYLAGEYSNVYDEATAIAELIVLTTNNELQPHFNEKAKAFIRSAILFVTYAEVYQDRNLHPLNLVTVKECIYKWFSAPEKMKVFAEICNNHPNLKSVAGAISMIASEERQSVLATVLRHTEFLDSQNVQQSFQASDFNPNNLKDEKMSVYLVLPANRITAYSRLARVWIGSLLQSMMHNTIIPRHRVLFMLDEIGQLGKLDVLLSGLSLGRGYGIDIWVLFQDIGQIESAYGDNSKTFFANTKYQQFFGVRDLETAKYISERLGKATITTTSHSTSIGENRGSSSNYSYSGEQNNRSSGNNNSYSRTESINVSNMARELLQPDEVMRLDDSKLIVLMAERNPVIAQKYDTRDQFFMNALETLAISDDTSSQRMITGE